VPIRREWRLGLLELPRKKLRPTSSSSAAGAKGFSVACSKFALRVLVFLGLALLGVKADVLFVGQGYSWGLGFALDPTCCLGPTDPFPAPPPPSPSPSPSKI
jgi:hypothetical protein